MLQLQVEKHRLVAQTEYKQNKNQNPSQADITREERYLKQGAEAAAAVCKRRMKKETTNIPQTKR